jgi:multidrug efflux pump subunit AcrB
MRQTFVEDFKTVVAGPEGNYYPVNLDLSSKGVKQVIEIVNDIVRKDGVFEVGFSGSWFSNRIIVDQMIFILLIAILLLYFILASQFESLIQPLIILSEVVIDIFFALLAMWTFGVSINLMSLIGLVVISGIVINDSILKIDTINRMRKEGKSLENAVFCASSRRIKAIIMTSLTTILAVCPFLVKGSMGADLQYPMSLVIIVGMLFGTLVSLFVVPTLYYSIYNGRKDR